MTLNVKMVLGEGGYGSGNRTSDAPIWSRIMFSFAQNKWNNIAIKPLTKFSNFASRLKNNCFHMCGKKNTKKRYYIKYFEFIICI